jgi:hypothetical protein
VVNAVLYYKFDSQLFLQPQLFPHGECTCLSYKKCFFVVAPLRHIYPWQPGCDSLTHSNKVFNMLEVNVKVCQGNILA